MSTGDIKSRWKRFAEKIAEGQSATDAYLAVGYRPSTREVAHRAASRLRANPKIRTYIQNLRETADQEARDDTTLTIREKLAFLARIVKTSAASLAEDDELIQSHRILKDGRATTRIPCKLKALKMHSELAGHLAPVRPEPTPPVDTLQLLFDQIRAGRTLTDQSLDPDTSQPDPSPKKVRSFPATIGASTTGAAHTSHNGHQANANKEPSAQTSQTQQTTTISPQSEMHPQAGEPAPTSPFHPTSPHCPSTPTETVQAITYPPPPPERALTPTAPPPVCQLNRAQRDGLSALPMLPLMREAAQQSKTELLKTLSPPPHSPPITPAQIRRLEQAQIRQNSQLYHPHPISTHPPSPPRVIRP